MHGKDLLMALYPTNNPSKAWTPTSYSLISISLFLSVQASLTKVCGGEPLNLLILLLQLQADLAPPLPELRPDLLLSDGDHPHTEP